MCYCVDLFPAYKSFLRTYHAAAGVSDDAACSSMEDDFELMDVLRCHVQLALAAGGQLGHLTVCRCHNLCGGCLGFEDVKASAVF